MIKFKLSNKNVNVENFPILSNFSDDIGSVWNVGKILTTNRFHMVSAWDYKIIQSAGRIMNFNVIGSS